MRRYLLGLAVLAVLTPLPGGAQMAPPRPGPAAPVVAPLSIADARHLLARTGFAATPGEIAAFEGSTRADAVRRVLAATTAKPVTPAPAWTRDPPPRGPGRDASDEEKRAFNAARRDEMLSLVGWWYREMVATPSPLTERMTLFWHNHFTSSFEKVRSPVLLYRQNMALREHALGNFGKLLAAMAADPAMIIYLDSVQNRRGQPNENFARELLELFTLGEGRGYGEADIKEAARAFTGWSLDRDTGTFKFRKPQHDDGEKSFLGRTGAFDGADILAILLQQPRTAEYITEKAWREFVSETPDPAAVQRIAARFRTSGYEIKVLIGDLLLTPAFWAPENRGRLVRSPTELMVGTLRLFGLGVGDERLLFQLGRALGQQLLQPPNVKGWPGGTAWINANTLLMRQQVLRRLTAPAPRPRKAAKADEAAPPGTGDDPAMPMDMRKAERAPERPAAAAGLDLDRWYAALDSRWRTPERLALLLLPLTPIQPPATDADPARFVRDLVADPVYQLK